MNKTPLFPTHAQEQRLLSETMARIRERNAARIALMGWPVLEGGK